MEIDLFCSDEDLVLNDIPAQQTIKQDIQEANTTIQNITSFASFQIPDAIQRCLKAHAITRPTEIQAAALPIIQQHKNTVVVAPTASGKTLTFLLPIISDLQVNPRFFHSIILTPTRELAFQLSEQFQLYTSVFGLSAALFVGGTPAIRDSAIFDQGAFIIVATPGRLLEILRSRPKAEQKHKLRFLRFLVLDEADQFLCGAPQVDEAMREILGFFNQKEERTTIMTTATLTVEMRQLLENSRFNVIQAAEKVQTNLVYKYLLVPQQFYLSTYLLYFLESYTGFKIFFDSEMNLDKSEVQNYKNSNFNQCIIFVNNAQNAEILNRLLLRMGLSSTTLHGALLLEQRIQNLAAFKVRRCRFLVATDVASRGLDIPLVSLVVNYTMPRTVVDYLHRSGRCMRNSNLTGNIINLYLKNDFLIHKIIQQETSIKIQKITEIEDFVTNKNETVDDEKLVRACFAKVIRAEKEIRLEMVDQNIGQRLKWKNKSKQDNKQTNE